MNYFTRCSEIFLRTFFFITFLVNILFAGQTGKIAGTISDKKTGDPIIGASIILQNTKMGASTDFEGYFSINNIAPGTYAIVISTLGYKTVTVNTVVVKIDLTTELNVKMDETVIEGEAVVIEAERPLVQKDLTSSSVTVSSEEMKLMPVENLTQVINLQAGVVDGHFRGGRSGEVAYLIDGIPVNNPLDGRAGFTPENAAVREMEVISGTFNAEYGQAMSGVVNIVTQDGSKDFHGSVGMYVGDYLMSHTDIWVGLEEHDIKRLMNYQFSVNGPLAFDGLTFFATGRLQDEKGYLYGIRYQNMMDMPPVAFTNPFTGERAVVNFNTGDSAYVSMNPSKRYSFSGKITYAWDIFKISYGGFWEKSTWKEYNHDYKYVPDGILTRRNENWMQNFQVTHFISNSTLQTLKFSVNKFWERRALYDDPYDPRYLNPDFGGAVTPNTFRHGGNQTNRFNQSTQTMLGQWSISSQISKEHKVVMGVEGKTHTLYNHSVDLLNTTLPVLDSITGNTIEVYNPSYPDLGTVNNQEYTTSPIEASAYIQDKIEYDIMIINAGVRYDYFDPNIKVLYDLRNPTRNPAYVNAGRKRDAKVVSQISPRLGVSFPITDQGIIHFSYGHFFQIPNFGNLYRNPNYLISQVTTVSTIMGNPELDAQRTVSYELGLQQQFFTNIGIDFTVYYRDIRNLLATEIIQSYEGYKYARYINSDYGNVRGFILSLEKRYSDFWSMRLDYTYQIAEGNSSDPLSVYYDNQSDPPALSIKKVLPLDWDQRSTLNASVNVGEMGDWNVGLIGEYGNGFPYTPSATAAGALVERNMWLKPTTFNLNFRVEKNFKFADLNLQVYLLVYNILDTKNEYNVDGTSGRANKHIYTAAEGYAPQAITGLNTYEQFANNPTSFSTPRNYHLGVNIDF